MNLKTLVLSVAALVAAAIPASAMDYSYRVIGQTMVVDTNGDIGPHEQETFGRWLKTVPIHITNLPNLAFVLNSNGGNPASAAVIANFIHTNNVNTGVAEGGTCASACAIIWAAGAHKSVSASSRVGVHGTSLGGMIVGDWTVAIAKLLRQYGAPATVVAAAATTDPDSIYWLTAQDYADWGVNVRP